MRLCRLIFLLLITAGSAFGGGKPVSWLQVRSPHFAVITDSNERDARRVAGQLERLRGIFERRFPYARVDTAVPMVVFALRDRKEFTAMEPQAYLAKGQLDLAGLFLPAPDKSYILLRLDSESDHPYSAIYHEYTHFVTGRSGAVIPLWLNEGFAQFVQTAEIRDKEVDLGRPSVENIRLLRQNHLLPLELLFKVDHNSPYYHEDHKGSIFYAESWALTHMLEFLDRHDSTNRVDQYLALINNQRMDSVTAATQAFGDFAALQKKLQTYVTQPVFPYITVAGSTTVDDKSFTAQPLPTIQADALRADFLAYDGRIADARALIEKIQRQEPENVQALETLGYLTFRDGDLEKAMGYYERAVIANSQNFLAHYYFALMAWRTGAEERHPQQIEASLRTAIKLNPEFGQSYDLLAVMLSRRGQNADEAIALSRKATELEPGNFVFRLNRASVLMSAKRLPEAMAALDAAAQLAATPEQRQMAQREKESILRYKKGLEENAAREAAYRAAVAARGAQASETSPAVAAGQPEPDDPPGPRHVARGVIRGVQCAEPATITFRLEGTKSLVMHTRNYFKIQYSALGFTPTGDLNPCTGLENMKAKVEYFESTKHQNQGQPISVELSK